jgi:hypothetical protein
VADPPKVREELLPRWKLVKRVVEERVPDDGFDDELGAMAVSFVRQLEEQKLPAPEPEQVVDRLRSILRHVDAEHQRLVLVSSERRPYFGVMTAKGVGVEKPAELES